jgi:epsilon-lactone hydrolase
MNHAGPSIRGRIANMMVRAVVKHWPQNDHPALVRRARRIFGSPKLSGLLQQRGLRIEEVTSPVRGEWLLPPQPAFPDAVLLYLHGGGYLSCSPRSHRAITASLARMIGCRVFSLDYRLAPEHSFPAPVEDAVAAFQWLVASGVKPEKIALAGDSAGGGLALAALHSLREKGLPLPACAACIAPLADMTGEHAFTNATSCAMFLPVDGRAFAEIYLNGQSPKSQLASPLLGELAGMPPLLIQVSDKELLFDDAVRLHDKAKAAGADTRLHVYAGLPHVWHIFIGSVPEATQALREIAEFVKEHV